MEIWTFDPIPIPSCVVSRPPCTGRKKTLLLGRKNDWYGACFGMLRQPLRPATAAAAIDGRNKKIWNKFFVLRLFLLRLSIQAKFCGALVYCGTRNRRRSAAIKVLLYSPQLFLLIAYCSLKTGFNRSCLFHG